MVDIYKTNIELEIRDNKQLVKLCGKLDENLRQIEDSLEVIISNRGSSFNIRGYKKQVLIAVKVMKDLFEHSRKHKYLEANDVHICIQENAHPEHAKKVENKKIKTKLKQIQTRSPNQASYVANIREHDITFGIGPAGTGKTYLAVACAVEALENDVVKRIILVRPAVEAGEKLGFLPGDLNQKIDPYLRPLYDALYEMLSFEKVSTYIEKNIIEIAPLAYMRGRTLNDSFIIMDESQNTTCEQMKMFLTRIGFGSKAVITGDSTQVDLPHGKRSGLIEAMEILRNNSKIKFNIFKSDDVVRHPLVQHIIEAYARHEERKKANIK